MASEVKFTYELPSQEQDNLHRELKTGANKEVFERWAEAVEYHCIDTRFCVEPMHRRDACPSIKLLVNKELMLQRMIIPFQGLQFKNDCFIR